MLARAQKTGQALARRARIVLAAASGMENKAICAEVGADANTVGKWRRRFAEHRLDGLFDEPRPGTPRKIGDDEIAETIRLTLETRPPGATHWSLRSMAKAVGYAPSTIHRIWRAFGLQPHRTETFKLSNDPLFVEKVRDIVGLYMAAPERALVLCVDEKSQIEALDRSQPLLPMRPGQVERRTHDYTRHGTTSLFAARIATGAVIGRCYRSIARANSESSWIRSRPAFPPISTCIWLWTTTPPTREGWMVEAPAGVTSPGGVLDNRSSCNALSRRVGAAPQTRFETT